MMKEFRFIAMCALLLAVAGVGAQELTPKSAYALGEACFEQKKNADAIGYYKQMGDSLDIFAMDKIARCYYYLDDYNNAAHWYKLVGDNINLENYEYVSPGYLEKMAEKGNPKSMAVLAWYWYEKFGYYTRFGQSWFEQEMKKWQAAYLVQKLMDMQWRDIQTDDRLGYIDIILLKDRLDRNGYQPASEPYSAELVKKAKKKNVVAMRELGECLLFGYGCKPATKQEVQKQLGAAIKKGDIEAMYFRNLIKLQNLVPSVEISTYFLMAQNEDVAQNGHVLSQYMTGRLLLYLKRPQEAVAWLTKAAEGGNIEAMKELYHCYGSRSVNYGIEADQQKLRYWMERMADAGDNDFQYIMGLYYYNGISGYMVDYGKAFSYFEHAATGNEPSGEAMRLLAQCYMNGRGVARDVQKGKEWLNRAALYRNKDAQKTVQLLKGM